MPYWNLMAPPELTAHWPISLFTKPIEVTLGVPLWMYRNLFFAHGVECRFSEVSHADKPLIGQIWFDGCFRSVGVG